METTRFVVVNAPVGLSVCSNVPVDPPGQLQTDFKTGLTPGRLSSRLLCSGGMP